MIKRLRVPLNQLTCLVNLLSSREGGQGSVVKDPGRHPADGLVWGLLRGPLGGRKVLPQSSEARVESEPKGCRETSQIWSRILCVCGLFAVPLWDSVSIPGVRQ